MNRLSISLSSPPDRKKLVADLICDNEQWAELNQEGESLSLEIYPRRSGEPWTMDFAEVLAQLNEGKRRLIGDE
jgi:hypothetical protein